MNAGRAQGPYAEASSVGRGMVSAWRSLLNKGHVLGCRLLCEFTGVTVNAHRKLPCNFLGGRAKKPRLHTDGPEARLETSGQHKRGRLQHADSAAVCQLLSVHTALAVAMLDNLADTVDYSTLQQGPGHGKALQGTLCGVRASMHASGMLTRAEPGHSSDRRATG